jgi:hypothetical protein
VRKGRNWADDVAWGSGVDEHCIDVARVFYEIICDGGMSDLTVCQALHRAVRSLRDRHLTLEHFRGDLCYHEGLNDGSGRHDTNENQATDLYLQTERDAVLLKNLNWRPHGFHMFILDLNLLAVLINSY